MQAKPIGGARRTAIYFVTIAIALFIPLNGIWAAVPPLNDGAIRNAVEDEFFWSPFVNGEDIQVRVEEGKATLTGTVGSLREFKAATENAYDGGAASVNNRLIVQ